MATEHKSVLDVCLQFRQQRLDVTVLGVDAGGLADLDALRAAQAAGKIPIDVRAMNIDLVSLTAHKFYGPKGCGALFVRRTKPRLVLAPQVAGGGQEGGLRSGTLNVPGIVGLGQAAEICRLEMAEEESRLGGLRDRLLAGPERVAHSRPAHHRLAHGAGRSLRAGRTDATDLRHGPSPEPGARRGRQGGAQRPDSHRARGH